MEAAERSRHLLKLSHPAIAFPTGPTNLGVMYSHRRYLTSVRSRKSRYGERPFPADTPPAEGALLDLATAPTPEIPLIIARYAALRAWTLCHDSGSRAERGRDAVESHALSAAVEQLESTSGDWAELELLRKALARPGATRTARVMDAAAAAAAAMGHVHGARALREAVLRVRWSSFRFRPPSSS